MAKRSPRLLFTEEELETPELQKPIRKAEKAGKKLEKAESRIPKKKIVQKQRVYDPKENQVVTRLVFEETEKKRPSKLTHAAAATPLNAVSAASHRELHEDADGSVSARSPMRSSAAPRAVSAHWIPPTAHCRINPMPER